MNPVDQTIVSKEDGDCTRACVASILDLTIEQVPHFLRFKATWFNHISGFFWTMGYKFEGTAYLYKDGKSKKHCHSLWKTPSIKGYFIATVPSKTFDNIGHSVIINKKGIVVHDPNPNKKWQNVNVRKSKDLECWMMWNKREKGATNPYV